MQVFQLITQFKSLIEIQFGTKMKSVQTGYGGEYRKCIVI